MDTHKRNLHRSKVLAAATVLSFGASALAQSWVHDPATPGDWFTASNWSTNSVPTSFNSSFISNGGTAVVGTGSATTSTLSVGSSSGGGNLASTGGQLTTGFVFVGSSVSGSSSSIQLSNNAIFRSTAAAEDIGYGGTGSFIQTGGTNSAAGVTVGYSAAANYQLSGGALVSTSPINIGGFSNAPGTFIQSGGSVSTGTFSIGIGFNGSYQLSGGSISTNTMNLNSSGAAFVQSGGTSTVTTLSLAAGTKYSMSAGTLNLQNLINSGTINFSGGAGVLNYTGIADFSTGTFANPSQLQVSGGANSLILLPTGVDPTTYFGSFTSQGIVHPVGTPVTISAGQSIIGSGTIGDHLNISGNMAANGIGITLNNGVTVSGSASLSVSTINIYDTNSGISSGNIYTQIEQVGSSTSAAAFTQSGGTHTATSLSIAAGSHYSLASGTLQIGYTLDNAGTMDFSGGNLAVNGIVNLARGSMTNPSSVSVTTVPNSLLIVPANFQTSQFKQYSGTGIVHNLGSPLVIPAGTSIHGSGQIDDQLICYGYINPGLISQPLYLNNGVIVQPGGTLGTLGWPITIAVNDSTSSDNGGFMTSQLMTLGSTAPANFSAASATMYVNTLNIGAGSSATFTVSGAASSVTAVSLNLGLSSSGTFTQNAGFVDASANIATQKNVSATYHLIGGTFNGGITVVGQYGNGTFTQDGGINSAWIQLGANTGSTGLYQMNAGTASASVIQVGYLGSGTFTQTGGTVGGSFTSLSLGNNRESTGSYQLSAGSVTTSSSYIGEFGTGTLTQTGGTWTASTEYVGDAATGSVTQSAGTHSVTGLIGLNIGFIANGTYQLTGGTLSASNETLGGTSPGTFSQSGGVHTITGALTINNHGEFDFAGGSLTAGSLKMTTGSLLDLQLDPSNPFSPISIVGATTFAGNLRIDLLGTSLPDPLQSYIELTSGLPITGQFSDIASGSRLTTSDGRGSFLVTYNSTAPYELVLSNFQVIPEPSSAALLFLAAPLLARRRQRSLQ